MNKSKYNLIDFRNFINYQKSLNKNRNIFGELYSFLKEKTVINDNNVENNIIKLNSNNVFELDSDLIRKLQFEFNNASFDMNKQLSCQVGYLITHLDMIILIYSMRLSDSNVNIDVYHIPRSKSIEVVIQNEGDIWSQQKTKLSKWHNNGVKTKTHKPYKFNFMISMVYSKGIITFDVYMIKNGVRKYYCNLSLASTKMNKLKYKSINFFVNFIKFEEMRNAEYDNNNNRNNYNKKENNNDENLVTNDSVSSIESQIIEVTDPSNKYPVSWDDCDCDLFLSHIYLFNSSLNTANKIENFEKVRDNLNVGSLLLYIMPSSNKSLLKWSVNIGFERLSQLENFNHGKHSKRLHEYHDCGFQLWQLYLIFDLILSYLNDYEGYEHDQLNVSKAIDLCLDLMIQLPSDELESFDPLIEYFQMICNLAVERFSNHMILSITFLNKIYSILTNDKYSVSTISLIVCHKILMDFNLWMINNKQYDVKIAYLQSIHNWLVSNDNFHSPTIQKTVNEHHLDIYYNVPCCFWILNSIFKLINQPNYDESICISLFNLLYYVISKDLSSINISLLIKFLSFATDFQENRTFVYDLLKKLLIHNEIQSIKLFKEHNVLIILLNDTMNSNNESLWNSLCSFIELVADQSFIKKTSNTFVNLINANFSEIWRAFFYILNKSSTDCNDN